MSPRELQLWRYLDSRRDVPNAPNYAEMTAALGINSKSSIRRWLDGLEVLGFITRTKMGGKRCYVRLTDKVPAGEHATIWWCVEVERLDKPGVRVFQPLTLSAFKDNQNRLAQELLCQPDRKPLWKRVAVSITEA